MPSRRLLIVLACCLAFPASASANAQQASVMMDDDNLLYRTSKTADKTLDTMASLGVDYIRLTVLWSVVAERAQKSKAAKKAFRRYGADDPRAYPKGNWDRYDHVIRSAGARGI